MLQLAEFIRLCHKGTDLGNSITRDENTKDIH